MKWIYKMFLLVLGLFLLGFYFGDITVGDINIKDRLRNSCDCEFLIAIEEFFKS